MQISQSGVEMATSLPSSLEGYCKVFLISQNIARVLSKEEKEGQLQTKAIQTKRHCTIIVLQTQSI